MKKPTKLSLGKLRPVKKKTKERSPVLIGTLLLQQSTLKCLIKQMNESRADDEIPCNLAGWFNDDAQGKYITVQLSAAVSTQGTRTSALNPAILPAEERGKLSRRDLRPVVVINSP